MPMKKKKWWRSWSSWISLPAALLILLIGGLGIRELVAAWQFDSQYRQIKSAGQPVDNADLEARFDRKTSTEFSRRWNDLLVASAALAHRGHSIFEVVNGKVPNSLLIERKWDSAEAVRQYLRNCDPVIQQLHELPHSDQPVWLPVKHNGLNTLLGGLHQSRQLQQLLMLDFLDSIYSEDRQRAKRDLQSMQKVADAFGWRNGIVTDLVHFALQSSIERGIHLGLAANFWQRDDLEELVKVVPKTIQLDLQALVHLERSYGLSWITTEEQANAWLYVLAKIPTLRQGLLEDYLRLENGQAVDPKDLSVLGMHLVPAMQQVHQIYDREEDERRLTLVALAIKHFQLQHGRWPESITEVELSKSPLVKLGRWGSDQLGSFGYSNSPVIENGNDVVAIWDCTQPLENSSIAKSWPTWIDAEGIDPNTGRKLVTIR